MSAPQEVMLDAVPDLPAAAKTCLAGYGFHTANHVAEVAAQVDGRRGLLAALSQGGLSDDEAQASLAIIVRCLPLDAALAAARPVDTSQFGLGALGALPPGVRKT
jgi:hypothetical protein